MWNLKKPNIKPNRMVLRPGSQFQAAVYIDLLPQSLLLSFPPAQPCPFSWTTHSTLKVHRVQNMVIAPTLLA